eukprot:172618_1
MPCHLNPLYINDHNRNLHWCGAHDGEGLTQIVYRTPPPLSIEVIRSNYDELEMKHGDLDIKIDKMRPMEMGHLTLNKTSIYHDTLMGDIRNKKLSHLTATEH